MRGPRYPVRIRNEKGTGFIAVVDVAFVLRGEDGDVGKLLKAVEGHYTEMINHTRGLLGCLDNGTKRVEIYWDIGSAIKKFLDFLDRETPFYLANKNSTLARDLGIGLTTLCGITRLRKSIRTRKELKKKIENGLKWACFSRGVYRGTY